MPFGIVAYAFMILSDNLSRNSCKQRYMQSNRNLTQIIRDFYKDVVFLLHDILKNNSVCSRT